MDGKEILRNIERFLPTGEEICVRKAVRVEGKGERLEPRFLVVSTRRLFILSVAKGSPRVETSLHFLSILNIESSQPELLVLVWGNSRTVYHVGKGDGDEIIANILTALKSNLPATPFEQLIRLNVEPATRLDSIKTLVSRATKSVTEEHGPCGGFCDAYEFVCDYYHVAHEGGIEWDINTIYHLHGVRELNLQDFDHLDPRDLVPVVGALAYNKWFTGFLYQGTKLTSEGLDALARALELSTTLEQLKLTNSGLNRDSIHKLTRAIAINPETVLKTVDFSGNSLEDRGIAALSSAVYGLRHGLEQLRLSKVGLNSRGVGPLAQALKKNTHMSGSLKVLVLSDNNHLKSEGIQSLMDFLVEPNVVQHLDFSKTDCNLEHLFNGLLRGCCQNLQHLDLSYNAFSARKSREGPGDTKNAQLFFGKAQQLKVVKLSSCRLPTEALKAVMRGLIENDTISGLDLDISNNELNADVLAEGLQKVRCLGALNLSNSELNDHIPRVCQALTHCPSPLKQLAIGENFSGKSKGSSTAAWVAAVGKLISAENSSIESLSLADSKLRNAAGGLFGVLATNESLTELDISGNYIGDRGIRMLSKALQVNSTLRTVYWDNNGTSPVGFRDVANALHLNRTMLDMPTPVHDVAAHLRDKVELHLREIQECLNRNHSVRRFEADQATRRQQQIMVSTTQQQTVDRVVVAIHDIIANLDEFDLDENEIVVKSKELIKDANKISQLLLRLHSLEVEETISDSIEKDMQRLASDLQEQLSKCLKETGLKMENVAVSTCPSVVSEQLQDDIKAVLKEQQVVDSQFVVNLFVQGIGLDVMTKACQVNYESAEQVCEVIVEQMTKQLKLQTQKLNQLLQEKTAERNASAAAEAADGKDRVRSDTADGPMMNRLLKHTFKKSRPASMQLDSPSLVREGPPLHHLGKDRPRGPANRARPRRLAPRPSVSDEMTSSDLFVPGKADGLEETDTSLAMPQPVAAPAHKALKPPVVEPANSFTSVKPLVVEPAVPHIAMKPPVSTEQQQLTVKGHETDRAMTMPAGGKGKVEDKKKGGSAFGFFKKKKSPADEKQTPPKVTTQNEASVLQIREAEVDVPVEEQNKKQSGSGTESRAPKVIAGPGPAFGAQLVAELKQKKRSPVEDGESERPAVPQDVPEDAGMQKKIEKPTPKPRVGVSAKMGPDYLSEMKDKQEMRRNTSASKPFPPVKPKPISPKPSRTQRVKITETPTAPEESSLVLPADETAVVAATGVTPSDDIKPTVPSERETEKDVAKETEPGKERLPEEQQDQTATQLVAEKGEENMEESVEQKPTELEEIVATEIAPAEEAKVKTPHPDEVLAEEEKPKSDEPVADKSQLEEQLSTRAAAEPTDKSVPEVRLPEEEETAFEEKQSNTPTAADDSTKHEELTSEQIIDSTAEAAKHKEHENVSRADEASSPEPSPEVESAESDAKSRDSPKVDQEIDSPDHEELGKEDVSEVAELPTESGVNSSEKVGNSPAEDISKPETESKTKEITTPETDNETTTTTEEAADKSSVGVAQEALEVLEV